jgi:predicted HTH domain antitoxin
VSDTVKYVLEFPRAGVDGLWSDEGQAAAEMKEAAVLELFRQKRISVRRGAELLGLTYRGFLDLASRHQISLFEYEEGELEDEVEALRSLTSPAP